MRRRAVGPTAADRPRRGGSLRPAAGAGIAAPLLFVGVFTLEGWLRPGYSPAAQFVSELSLGPRGWTQVTSFVLTGALVVVFARGLRAWFRAAGAGTAGPVLLVVIGVALAASGPFVTDPSAPLDRHTGHGTIHQLLGAVVFALAPVSCLVLHRRFRRDPAWRPLSGFSLAAGLVLVAEVVLLKVAQQPGLGLFAVKGLVQRVLLCTFLGWLLAVAARLWLLSGAPARASAEPDPARRPGVRPG